jgi:hypothetical protein
LEAMSRLMIGTVQKRLLSQSNVFSKRLFMVVTASSRKPSEPNGSHSTRSRDNPSSKISPNTVLELIKNGQAL